MMKKFYFLFLLMLLPLAASADDVEINGIYYTLDAEAKTAMVVSNPSKYSGDIVIPEAVAYKDDTYSVTIIQSYAFNSCPSLNSVVIPNSVITVGDFAFALSPALTSVTIGSCLAKLSFGMFTQSSGLTSVTIPNTVTTIDDYAFKLCTGLTSVVIPNSVTSIGNWVFQDCSNLSSITFSENLTHVGFYSFDGTPWLDSQPDGPLYIGKVLNKIKGDDYFYEKREFEIKDGTVSISEDAFLNCFGLTSVIIPNSVTTIEEYAFDNCRDLESVTIPNSVTFVGEKAFVDTPFYDNMPDGLIYFNSVCYKYKGEMPENTEIDIKEGTTCITDYAFDGCSGLTSVNIPEGVTYIGGWAFRNCSSLTSLVIPSSVTALGSAFPGCSGLESIVIKEGNTVYDSRENCNAIIVTASNHLIKGCKNSFIPNSVTFLESSAFAGCAGLTSIVIPSSVKTINASVFSNCTDLSSVTFENGLQKLYSSVFSGCKNLTSILIPQSVNFIAWNTFMNNGITSYKVDPDNKTYDSRDNCNAIIETSTNTVVAGNENTIIPLSVTEIGSDAFRYKSMETVIIPKSITAISHRAYGNCNELKDVFCYAEKVPETQPTAFYQLDLANLTLHVPATSIEDYKAAEPWNQFGNIVAIDEEETEETIKITSAGQTTWCSAYDLDFTNVAGLKAYIAAGYNRTTGTIWLMRVFEVPAKEGILLMGDPGEYKVPHKSTTTYYMNMFKGTLEDITINETDGEYTNYYLSNGDSGVGFYKVNGSIGIKANRAYLPLLKGTAQAGTRFIGIDFGDGTTNLTPALSKGEGEGEWYTLQGQRVTKPGKGLYIRNGKKVVIK